MSIRRGGCFNWPYQYSWSCFSGGNKQHIQLLRAVEENKLSIWLKWNWRPVSNILLENDPISASPLGWATNSRYLPSWPSELKCINYKAFLLLQVPSRGPINLNLALPYFSQADQRKGKWNVKQWPWPPAWELALGGPKVLESSGSWSFIEPGVLIGIEVLVLRIHSLLH